jgi:GNAT superfamily N-acetyltransferase
MSKANLQTKPLSVPVVRDHWIGQLDDGTHVLIRPLLPGDRARELDFIRSLSSETRYNRFLGELNEVSPALLEQLMDVNDHERVALVALVQGKDELVEIGVCRYAAAGAAGDCECAVSVADAWQHRGLGQLLMGRLMDIARRNGYRRLFSLEAATNFAARKFARSLGFEVRGERDDPTLVSYSKSL